MRRSRRVSGMLIIALVGVAGAAVPAHAATTEQYPAPVHRVTEAEYRAAAAVPSATWWYIYNFSSDLVLAVSASSDADGAKIIQWKPLKQLNGLPALEQAWNPQPVGDYVYYLNAGTNPWKTFGISGGSVADGAKAIQWKRVDGDQDQEWYPYWVSQTTFALINHHSGKCLAIPNGSIKEGTQAIQWGCNFSLADQQWYYGW